MCVCPSVRCPSAPVLRPRLERNTFGSSILTAQKRFQNDKTLTLDLEHLRKSNYRFWHHLCPSGDPAPRVQSSTVTRNKKLIQSFGSIFGQNARIAIIFCFLQTLECPFTLFEQIVDCRSRCRVENSPRNNFRVFEIRKFVCSRYQTWIGTNQVLRNSARYD